MTGCSILLHPVFNWLDDCRIIRYLFNDIV